MQENGSSSLQGVKHIMLVVSGKGGVGKSSVTVQLAMTLVLQGFKVGVLDVDLTGPSIPRMFGLEDRKVHQGKHGWVPVYVDDSHRLSCMSIGFLLRMRGDSVVWRGPKKTTVVKNFLTDVMWGELDYLLIDTPPGTSDEHISIAEQLRDANPDGAVLVTTPQAISTTDVRKELNFCRKVGLKTLGVIENMSGFVCPHCSECTNVFSTGGGEAMAQEFGIEFLGRIPIDPQFVRIMEQQREEHESLLKLYQESMLAPIFADVAEKLILQNPN